MIDYPHFAVPDLHLMNGYIVHGEGEGVAYEFQSHSELERCVGRILIRRPTRLNGAGLRFLRRLMGRTQAQFGERIDRDAQTVARMEKDASETVEKHVDIIARLEFAIRFDPQLSAAELNLVEQGLLDGANGPYYLTFENGHWHFLGQGPGVQRLVEFVSGSYPLQTNMRPLIDFSAYPLQPPDLAILKRSFHQSDRHIVIPGSGYVATAGEPLAFDSQMALQFNSALTKTVVVPRTQNEFCLRS